MHADNGDADDDDLAGVDIVQEQGTHPDEPDPNAGSEGDSQEDPPDADAGIPHPHILHGAVELKY